MLIDNLQWQQPWCLLLLAAPSLLLILRKSSHDNTKLASFVSRHLWPTLLLGQPRGLKQSLHWPFIGAWILASIALAGPFIAVEEAQLATRNSANIAIILDISPSMNVKDVDSQSRLDVSKRLLGDWLKPLQQHRIALIAFSANAYTVLPLTTDKGSFIHFLNALDPSMATLTGSNLSRALQLADEALSAPRPGQNDANPGLVVLISDGEIHDQHALTEATDLQAAGHRLYTFGVGTEQGGPVPIARGRLVREEGKLVTSQRQRSTMMALAQAGGGRYQDLSTNAHDDLLAAIEVLQTQTTNKVIRHRIEQPLFPLPLILALGLLLWSGLKRPESLAMILLLPFAFQVSDTEAAPWDEEKALQHLVNKNNSSAIEIYSHLYNFNSALGTGVAAYQMGDWPTALDAFLQAKDRAKDDGQRAQATYNQGNTLVQLGQLKNAVSAFERALELQPNFKPAAQNLLLVQRHLQQWGGEQQGEQSPVDRMGLGAEKDTSKPGAEAGENQPKLSSQGKTNQGGQPSQALQQSLKQWRQYGDSGGTQPPLQAWQQFQSLQEDNQAMLRRRFAIEDSQAKGLIEEKPW